MLKKTLWVAALVAGTLAPAYAQSDATQSISGMITGNFTKKTTTSLGTHSSSKEAGLLVTYRYNFMKESGLEFNYGIMRHREETTFGVFPQNSPFPQGAFSSVNLHEYSAAYVYRKPGKKFTPFLMGGAGALTFDQVAAAGTTSTKFEFVFGGGVEVEYGKRAFMRLQYRGQTYRIPGLGQAFGPNIQGWAFVSQPSVGVGMHF